MYLVNLLHPDDEWGEFICERYVSQMNAADCLAFADSRRPSEGLKISFTRAEYIDADKTPISKIIDCAVGLIFDNDNHEQYLNRGLAIDKNGPLFMETYTKDAGLDGAIKMIKRIGGKYGKYRFVKLTPVDRSVLESEVSDNG